MKKNIFVLLILSLFLSFSLKVNAYSVGDKVVKVKDSAEDWKIRYDRWYYIRRYHVKDSADRLYCADASLKADDTFVIQRELFADRCKTGSEHQEGCRDGSHDDYWEGLFDAALLFALNGNYYDDGTNIYDRSYTYEQRIMAIRALDNLNPYYGQNAYHTGFTANKDIEKNIINSAINWLADDSLNPTAGSTSNNPVNYVFGRYDMAKDQWLDTDLGSAGDITETEVKNHLFPNGNPRICNQYGNGCESTSDEGLLDTDYDIIKYARELFLTSLRYAGKYREGNIKGQSKLPKISNGNVNNITEETIDLGKSNNTTYDEYTREMKFEVTFEGFNQTNDGSVYVRVTPDQAGKVVMNGSTMYYKVLGEKEWHAFNANTDLSGLLKDQDKVTIKFAIPVKAVDIEKLEKFEIRTDINILYREYSIGRGYRLVPPGTTTGLQYFYLGQPSNATTDGVPHVQSINFIWEPYDEVFCRKTDPSPDNIDQYKLYLRRCCRERENAGKEDVIVERECKNAKTDAEKKFWCETKQKYCDYCNEKITVPYACTEFSDGTNGKSVPQCTDGADASVMSPTDVKICILDYTDVQNNQYQLTKSGVTNDIKNGETKDSPVHEYCSIYCKEDYKIGLPLGKWVTQGSTFTIDVQVDGTKSCYTDEINYNLFKRDYENAYNKIKSGSYSHLDVDNYNKILSNYDACATLSGNKKDNQKVLNIDSDKQTVEFRYYEGYFDNEKGVSQKVKLTAKDNTVNDDLSLWFCDGDVDHTYNKCLGGKPWDISKENLAGFSCDSSYKCKESTVTIPKTRFAKSVSSTHKLYVPETEFYSLFNGGYVSDISLSKGQLNAIFMETANKYKNIKDPIERINRMNIDYAKYGYKRATKTVYINEKVIEQESYPIKLSTEQGAYSYELFFSGFGEYYDADKYGRLIGNANSVAKKLNVDSFTGEYLCAYVVNCTGCKVTGDPGPGDYKPGKNFPGTVEKTPDETWTTTTYDPCPGCGVTTPGGDNVTMGELIFRQISLINSNPSDRSLGYNLINLKGSAAIKEIETQGEEIYNEGNGKISKYEVTLTPEVVNYINEYVKKHKNDTIMVNPENINCDTYYNMTLKDKNSTEHKVSERFDYLICKSGLLEKLKTDSSILNKAKVKNNLTNKSWVESEYCLGNECIIGAGYGYGEIYGPAYK